MDFLSVPYLVPWLKSISSLSSSELESSLISFAGSKSISQRQPETMSKGVCVLGGGGGGGQAIIRGSHDFKYFRPSKGGDKSRGGYNSRKYGHWKARLSYPVFILIIALIFKKKKNKKQNNNNKKIKKPCNFYCADTVSERWKTFLGVFCSLLWHHASRLIAEYCKLK